MINGRFHCIHCGDNFDLSPEEMETFEEGFHIGNPDCCDNCMDNFSYQEYDTYSDTDSGL